MPNGSGRSYRNGSGRRASSNGSGRRLSPRKPAGKRLY